MFRIAPLARTHGERRRRLALTTGFGSQIVWNRSNRCAGERGGARVGRPRWVRILTITGGSSITPRRGLAMIHSFSWRLGSDFYLRTAWTRPAAAVSLSIRLSINNSGLSCDLLVMSLQQPASGRSLDPWPRAGTSRRGGGRLSNN